MFARREIGTVLALAGIAGLSCLVRLPGFREGGFASHDVGGILYEAMLLRAGGLPYVDAIELKAPGTFYLATVESGEGRLNCDFVAAGHSRGGEAAHHLAFNLSGPLSAQGIEDQILRGVVAVAPRSKTSAEALNTSPEDEGSGSIPGEESIPYLILHGANDEDTTKDPTRAF